MFSPIGPFVRNLATEIPLYRTNPISPLNKGFSEISYSTIIIDREAWAIIRLEASFCPNVCLSGSVCPSICLSVNALTPELFFYWRGVVDIGTLPSTAKGPVKHKSATLLKNIRESSSQGAFKMVGHSKLLLFRQVVPNYIIAVDHAFNICLLMQYSFSIL